MTAGNFQVCALLKDSHVDCWGMNAYGGLGNGGESSTKPTEVNGIDDATHVSTGDDHSCAELATGHVTCWGENSVGELGDGTDTGPESCGLEGEDKFPCSQVPVFVSGIATAVGVGLGEWHSCAVLEGGHVACWGISNGNVPGEPDGNPATLPVMVP